MADWIKCSERLPEIDGETKYLGVNTAGYIAIFNELTPCAQPPENAPVTSITGWLSELGRLDAVIGCVTHWQPLPPQPEQE